MKKFFITSVAVIACLTLFSQNLPTTKVPQAVKEAFAKAHPNKAATWEREDAAYEVNFKENGKPMSCVIDRQGTILETESSISMNELPAVAKTYVDQHYKGKRIKEVAKIVKSSGEVGYEVNVQGKDVLFNSNGNHMEKPKEKAEKD